MHELQAGGDSTTTDTPDSRLARSHLINEIRQLELLIEGGADPSGELARQVQRLREKLAAMLRPAAPEPKIQSGDSGV